MEHPVARVVFVGGVIGLVALAVALGFCVWVGDILGLTTCTWLLAEVRWVVRTVAELVGR